jgi:hypothetical protein
MFLVPLVGLGFARRVERGTCREKHLMHNHLPLLPHVDEMMALLAAPDLTFLQMTVLMGQVPMVPTLVLETLTQD